MAVEQRKLVDASSKASGESVVARRWSIAIVLVTLAASILTPALGFAAMFLLPDDSYVEDFGLSFLKVIKPSFYWCLTGLLTASLAMMLIAGIKAVICKARLWGILTLIYGLIIWPLATCVVLGLAYWFSSWTTHDQISGPNGKTYVFLDYSLGQAQTMALGMEEEDRLFTKSYRIVGSTNGDHPRRWAPVIRPANARDNYGQLYVNDAGVIVGIRHDNQCFFTYDTARDQFNGHATMMSSKHGDVGLTSPFVLVGSDTSLNQADLKVVLDMEQAGRIACPTETIRQELAHSNPAVREVAKKIMDIRVKRATTTSQQVNQSTS